MHVHNRKKGGDLGYKGKKVHAIQDMQHQVPRFMRVLGTPIVGTPGLSLINGFLHKGCFVVCLGSWQ